ncbi:hypothetical protein N0V82_006168 [Gnomoniopsis sp. IMI 355080]|nr:hypothetical protein N0V82_006168 [Gnomoniopsis sp. IMI 355080]
MQGVYGLERIMNTCLLSFFLLFLLSPVRSLVLKTDLVDAHASHLAPRAPECKRTDDAVTTIVATAESFSSADAQVIIGTGGAVLFTCRVLLGLAGDDDRNPLICYNLSGMVLFTTAAVNGLVSKTKGTGATTADGNTPNPPPGRNRNVSLYEHHAAHMADLGVVWDSFEVLPVVEARANNSHPHGAQVVSRMSMLGIRSNDTEAVSGDRYDHLITTYSDGTGNVRLTRSPSASDQGQAGRIVRRHDGPGFKFSYRRFDSNDNFLGDPDQTVMGSDPKLIPAKIANDLGRLSNQNPYPGPNADGLVWAIAVDGVYSFAMSVIGEVQGFGDEYEDVNICGDMSGPCHDVFVAHSA